MADIELVIRIPEEDYERCKNKFQMRIDVMGDAIANGVVLPKGHGDLKDMNDLCYKSRYGCKGNCEYLHVCNSYGASTIVEADRTGDANGNG